MRVPREQVSVALFSLFTGNQMLANLCQTITRVPKVWSAVPENQRPWLQLFKGGPQTEDYSQKTGIGLTKYVLNYNLWLYLTADPTGTTLGETVINNIADQIDASMQARIIPGLGLQSGSGFGEKQTLGGLVNNAWLEGGSEWGREFEDTNITVFWRIAVETGI